MRFLRCASSCVLAIAMLAPNAAAVYQNFESSHVHPIAITPSGSRLLAVNTPDALLEIFTFDGSGNPVRSASVPVGLEPVSVVARTDSEAWVVNTISGTVSIVDLNLAATVKTLAVGKFPSDVAFAGGKAFVAVSHEDAVKVFNLANLSAAPQVVNLFARKIRALAVSPTGTTVYAVAQESGNQTAVVDANIITGNSANLSPTRLAALGINDMTCSAPPPAYPPLPGGIVRNPALVDPPDGIPKVGLIVHWDAATSSWRDEANQNWTSCLPFRLPDHDLFAIDTATLAVTSVRHLGTTLFEVSVNPANGKIYVPNTDARNTVRFEHALGVRGHVVDNRLSIVDPAAGNGVTVVDLNTHIDRASDPAANLAERSASISQPGMMTWKSDGSIAYLTAIGSRKLFVVDGSCLSGSCIFGPNRATPRAANVGEGPTGVALLESRNRLYVLNRFSNSVAVVDAPTLAKVSDIPLHDPSPAVVRTGRRFLYDGILSSGHGDAACSSCHISGDKDGLSWDLGDPTGTLAPYANLDDNVRFVVPVNGQPTTCDPAVCASHVGFDPQKGPMATQTLRGMLEPLHWRGDRPTMNDFNPAFVNLLGARDIGPINGKPAGLSASDMETFRQLALAFPFPANPNRNVDDTIPNVPVQVPGLQAPGNPTRGQSLFQTAPSDANQPCSACHALPFGAAGGRLGGVTPAEPTSQNAAALFNGMADQSPHSDLKIAHLRNIWDKPGFVFGPAGGPYPDVKTGFGLVHDGAIPNISTFLSFSVFNFASVTDLRDIASFVLHFPTDTKPAVGGNVTVPQGTPPTGSAADESLLSTLVSLGDAANAGRHCELTATALAGGRLRSYRLSGGAWATDVAGEPPLATSALRQGAQGPITFLCATLGSGLRLGGDRDEDGVPNGTDCAVADPLTWAPPSEISGLVVNLTPSTQVLWTDPSAATGPGLRFDVVSGSLSALRASGLAAATSCLAGGVVPASFIDARPVPPSGDGYFYLTRGNNVCAVGTFGSGRSSLDTLVCAP